MQANSNTAATLCQFSIKTVRELLSCEVSCLEARPWLCLPTAGKCVKVSQVVPLNALSLDMRYPGSKLSSVLVETGSQHSSLQEICSANLSFHVCFPSQVAGLKKARQSWVSCFHLALAKFLQGIPPSSSATYCLRI